MIEWGHVLERARVIAGSYHNPPTLRQVYYRLVAGGDLPNRLPAYKGLSARTATGRREGTFPRLADRSRSVEVASSWSGPEDARRWLRPSRAPPTSTARRARR